MDIDDIRLDVDDMWRVEIPPRYVETYATQHATKYGLPIVKNFDVSLVMLRSGRLLGNDLLSVKFTSNLAGLSEYKVALKLGTVPETFHILGFQPKIQLYSLLKLELSMFNILPLTL